MIKCWEIFFLWLSKQNAYGALVITRYRCSLAFIGKLMRFAPSNSLILFKNANSE